MLQAALHCRQSVCMRFSGSQVILESPLHGHGTDAPPATVQAACGLLDGVTLGVRSTRVTVVQQNLTQVQHRRHTCTVLLDVSLQLLNERQKLCFSDRNTQNGF